MLAFRSRDLVHGFNMSSCPRKAALTEPEFKLFPPQVVLVDDRMQLVMLFKERVDGMGKNSRSFQPL